MTLAHIVGADVTETNKWPCLTIMLFTGDHSLGTRKTQTLFKETNIILFLQSHLQVDSLILCFDLRDITFIFSTFCGVFKVFITNLLSTCWLAWISGQFCDGCFSKSVINTKTARTSAFQSRIIYFSAAQLASWIIIISQGSDCFLMLGQILYPAWVFRVRIV